jgi:hypothetical protein
VVVSAHEHRVGMQCLDDRTYMGGLILLYEVDNLALAFEMDEWFMDGQAGGMQTRSRARQRGLVGTERKKDTIPPEAGRELRLGKVNDRIRPAASRQQNEEEGVNSLVHFWACRLILERKC